MPTLTSASLSPATAVAPIRRGLGGAEAGRPQSLGDDPGAAHFRALLDRGRAPEGPNPARIESHPLQEAGRTFLAEARRQSQALDGVLAEAQAGRTFSSQELIGLQARIYRSSLFLETFSKVVESAASGAKQLSGTNL